MPYTIRPGLVAAFVDGYGAANIAADVDTAAVRLADAHLRQLDLFAAADALAFVAAQDFDTVTDADALFRNPARPLLPVIPDTFYDRAIALAWLIIYQAAQHTLAERVAA